MASEKSTSDLQTLLHYNRPKSTPPAAHQTSKEESTFGGPFRAASVVPFDSRASDERTPIMGVVRYKYITVVASLVASFYSSTIVFN